MELNRYEAVMPLFVTFSQKIEKLKKLRVATTSARKIIATGLMAFLVNAFTAHTEKARRAKVAGTSMHSAPNISLWSNKTVEMRRLVMNEKVESTASVQKAMGMIIWVRLV